MDVVWARTELMECKGKRMICRKVRIKGGCGVCRNGGIVTRLVEVHCTKSHMQ